MGNSPWAKVDDFCQSLLFPAQHNFLEFRLSSADENILLKFLFCILDEYLFFYFFVLDGFSNGGSANRGANRRVQRGLLAIRQRRRRNDHDEGARDGDAIPGTKPNRS